MWRPLARRPPLRAATVAFARRALSTQSPAATWESVGLVDDLSAALRSSGFKDPSLPQQLVIPAMLEGRSVAFTSQTGSGKTLAFLLPIMQQLKQQELEQPVLKQTSWARPRALVLAPTRDLVTQIGKAAKVIAHQYRLRVRVLSGSIPTKNNKNTLEQAGADLIVATPERLRLLYDRKVVSLRQVRHVIVDECDDMLMRGFDEDVQYLLSKCPPRDGEPPMPQVAFVSATLGADVQHVLRQNWPDVDMLVSSCAHRPPEKLVHELQPVKGEKLDELRRILLQLANKADGKSEGDEGSDGSAESVARVSTTLGRTLIFCRGVQSARAVQHSLVEAGFPAGGCHGSMPEGTRQADLGAFVATPPVRPLLVCTDVAARGIDFPGVERVINYDFPATSALYLHRAGRTARMGKSGYVLSLVQDGQRRFARSIRDAVERKMELHVVRKGDYLERVGQQANSSDGTGKAYVSKILGQEAQLLRRRGGRRTDGKSDTKGARLGKAGAGVPAWRMNKHYNTPSWRRNRN